MLKKYFVSIILLFFLTLTIFPLSTFGAVMCECSGEVRSGKINFGTGNGGTGSNAERDFRKFEFKVDKECVYGTIEKPYETKVECQLGIEGKYNSDTRHFFGSCEEAVCGDPTLPTKDLTKKLQLRKPILEIAVPDLKFTDLQNTVDSDGNIHIPWIGEYLKVIYRFAVTIASILGVVMLIREGLRIILSAGGDEKVQGYKNIGRVVTGLVLAWLSYVILYNINSDLVSFRDLKIALAPSSDQVAVEESESTDDQPKQPTTPPIIGPMPSGTTATAVKQPDWGREFDCNKEYPERGVVPRDQLSDPYDCNGKLNKKIITAKDMVNPLCKVAERAEKAGLKIEVTSHYRSFQEQVKLWCGDCAKKHPNTTERRKYCAVPGYSNHGKGRAVDVKLFEKSGKSLTIAGNSTSQCFVSLENIQKLANLFYKDENGNDTAFNRLETEIWHFEYGTGGQNSRGKYLTYPSKCKK